MTDEHKSEEMRQIALSHDWEAVVVPDLSEYEVSQNVFDIIWKLYAKRDLETLQVTWRGDTQIEANYKYGDYHLSPAWRHGVINLIKGKPNPKKFHFRDRGVASQVTYEEMLKDREVPWSDDEVPAFDILLAVLGKDIRWVYNGPYGLKERNEHCPKESNLGKEQFRVKTTSQGKRVLNFANAFGFHACYITEILEVS